MNDPERDDERDDLDRDPRNSEMEGEGGGMPAEFVDTPQNEPGDQSPPNPADV